MAKTPGVVKRRELADQGIALPDGSFPIKDKADLQKAISAFGLGKHPSQAKAHIIKRARALGATDMLPAKWMKQGVVKTPIAHSSLTNEEQDMTVDTISSIRDQQTDSTDEFLAHFGVKGMRWGVRHEPTSGGSGGGGGRSGGGSSSGRSSGGGSAAPAPRKGLSTGKKVAIGVGAAAVVALGAAAVAYNIKSGGKLPINALKVANDLKGSAFKAANGGFDRAKAITEIAKREGRSAALIGELKGQSIKRDLTGVAKTTAEGVSRLSNAGAERAGFAVGKAGVGIGRTIGNAQVQANLGAREARDAAASLSQAGRATLSRLQGESASARLLAARSFSSQTLGELKGVAKTTGEGVSRLSRMGTNAVTRAAAKSGPQALVNLRARKLLKGM